MCIRDRLFFCAQLFVIPENAVVSESKATAVNMTKERVVILVKLCITLSRHAKMCIRDRE